MSIIKKITRSRWSRTSGYQRHTTCVMLTSTVLRERKALMSTVLTRVTTKYGWIQSFIQTIKYKFHDHSPNVIKWFLRSVIFLGTFEALKSDFLVHALVMVNSLCFWNAGSNIWFLRLQFGKCVHYWAASSSGRPRVSSPVHALHALTHWLQPIQPSCTLNVPKDYIP